jgi:hypothetical protein
MTVYVLSANTVFDCSGEVFSSGYVVGVFDSYEKAEEKITEIGDTYTRKMRDYDIEEFKVS